MTWQQLEPMHTPSLAQTLRWLQTQIDRLATRTMGPVEVRDDEGSLTWIDSQGNITFASRPEGAQVRYKGGPASLTGVLETTDQRISDEAATRLAQDNKVNTQAIAYTNQQVSTEAATRLAQDNKVNTQAGGFAAAAEANAKAYSDSLFAAEKASRQASDSALASKDSALQSQMDANSHDIGVLQAQVQLLTNRINALENKARAAGWTL